MVRAHFAWFGIGVGAWIESSAWQFIGERRGQFEVLAIGAFQ